MQNLQDVFKFLIELMGQIGVLLVGVALLGFLWGVLKYIANGANPSARQEGRKFMLYGLLSLLVMVSLWGFVGLLSRTVGIKNSGDFLTPIDNSGDFDPSRLGSFGNLADPSDVPPVNILEVLDPDPRPRSGDIRDLVNPNPDFDTIFPPES